MIRTDADTINEILDLPENQPSIYEHMKALEDIDYNSIKDLLCLPDTKWNITSKNPGTVNSQNLLPEGKLWNTIVKRNLMPTSHNQTVDRKRLVLIHSIIFGNKFNTREVIARELSEACKNDKGILAFPCLISTLCHRHRVPTYKNDKYTDFCTVWDRNHYLKKMDVANVIPIQVAMPTPSHSEHTEALVPDPNQEDPAGSDPATPHVEPQGSPSAASAAQGKTPPLYILQLRNQIQRIEARQIKFIAESKVFQTTLLQFLHDNFPTAEFPPAPPAPPTAANSIATPSVEARETEEVHYSSNAELDAFGWHTPFETQPSPLAPASVLAPPTDITESFRARKHKASAARVIREDTPPQSTADPPVAADPPAQTSPAKRQRHYRVVLTDSDDDGSDEPTSSKSLAF
ncbi:hypothetical protein V6N13_024623 [Hibiscus sabdariffa]